MKKILSAISLLTLAALYTPAYAAIGLDGKMMNPPPACGNKKCPMHNPQPKPEKELEEVEIIILFTRIQSLRLQDFLK